VAPSSESKKSFESPANQSSVVEDALADLLAGPFDKVSITIPAGLRARVAERASQSNFSSYVTDILAQEEKRIALIEFLDQLDEEFGPPSAEQLATADLRWEEMWQRYESSTALS
jgi:hypothetical protein